MSSSEAALRARPAAGWALLGSELSVLFRRWRTWAMLAALAAIPVLIAIAVRITGGGRSGRWPHLWRIVGEYANVSVFDVESNDALHELLSGLPLFPYMDIQVTPLAKHPSSIA